MQTKAILEHVMDDVQAMAPPIRPNLEKLRMAYPSIGCWAPTCALLRCSLIVSEFVGAASQSEQLLNPSAHTLSQMPMLCAVR